MQKRSVARRFLVSVLSPTGVEQFTQRTPTFYSGVRVSQVKCKVLRFVWSSFLAIALVFLAYRFFPDPPAEHAVPASGGRQPGYSREAALAALKSTIAVLPLATLFIAEGWTSQLLVLVYAAIFSLSPELSKGMAASLKSLTSTLIGGLAAVVFYWLGCRIKQSTTTA